MIMILLVLISYNSSNFDLEKYISHPSALKLYNLLLNSSNSNDEMYFMLGAEESPATNTSLSPVFLIKENIFRIAFLLISALFVLFQQVNRQTGSSSNTRLKVKSSSEPSLRIVGISMSIDSIEID